RESTSEGSESRRGGSSWTQFRSRGRSAIADRVGSDRRRLEGGGPTPTRTRGRPGTRRRGGPREEERGRTGRVGCRNGPGRSPRGGTLYEVPGHRRARDFRPYGGGTTERA